MYADPHSDANPIGAPTSAHDSTCGGNACGHGSRDNGSNDGGDYRFVIWRSGDCRSNNGGDSIASDSTISRRIGLE